MYQKNRLLWHFVCCKLLNLHGKGDKLKKLIIDGFEGATLTKNYLWTSHLNSFFTLICIIVNIFVNPTISIQKDHCKKVFYIHMIQL